MENEEKKFNLDDMQKISDSDFQKHFQEWIEIDGVARTLQARLRKDLFESFNKTLLGRQLSARFQRKNRMVLSPVILALNSLVGEFLYAQNCHFTLSVFTTEVPYRSTLPDFEREQNFRFNSDDLTEIFQAIRMNETNEVAQEISRQYINRLTKDNSSLLYCIFKNIFKKKTASVGISGSDASARKKKHHVRSASVSRSELVGERPERSSGTRKSKHKKNVLYNQQFRYLNKYLIILSRKVKEIAINLEHIDKENVAKEEEHQREKNRKITNLNRSLEKISENLKLLSTSKKKSQKISFLLTAVDKMAQQLEKCASAFENLSKNVHELRDTPPKHEKSYTQWLKEMKTTKNGKKFLSKIVSTIHKKLNLEREKLTKSFDEKLENHKYLIKLKYNQKILEHAKKSAVFVADSERGKDLTDNIERKLQELSVKHQDLIEKIDKRVEPSPSSQQVLFMEKPEEKIVLEEKKSTGPYRPKVYEHLKPNVEEVTQTIVRQDRHLNKIVFDAKLRIQELEHESNILDRSFQDYLQKQKSEKSRLDENFSNIIEKYQTGKLNLNKLSVPKAPYKMDPILSRTAPIALDAGGIPQIEVNLEDIGSVYEKIDKREGTKLPQFENPFRKLQRNAIVNQILKRNTNRKLTDHFEGESFTPRSISVEQRRSMNQTDSYETLEAKDKPKEDYSVGHTDSNSKSQTKDKSIINEGNTAKDDVQGSNTS